MKALIEHFTLRDDLSSYDPYDIWKTSLGFRIKDLYNRRPIPGIAPASLFALFDDLVNNSIRLFYTKSEYPIVRAMAALSLVNLYKTDPDGRWLAGAERHLNWLADHSCTGYSGHCWGLGFRNAVNSNVIYDSNTPYSTMTPYALEAFVAYSQASRNDRFVPVMESIMRFFETDIQVMEEDSEALATSYGPFRDRIAVNAVSYTMYAYALWLGYASRDQLSHIEAKIRKLYAYIRRQQRADGSWFYSPDPGSFIDCFHSCIVLKNLIKTNALLSLPASEGVVTAGYRFLKEALLEEGEYLFRRFAVKNKQGLVRFDLYDNAEVLNLAILLGDQPMYERLTRSIVEHFCQGQDVYSQIDFLGFRRNRNTLRWAVMPFLFAASSLV